MKRTIYSALMSVLFGIVAGAVTTDVINIMYPDFGLDYKLAIAFFIALSWSLLTLVGLIFDRPSRAEGVVADERGAAHKR